MHVPPLRERAEDVPVLARHFLAEMGARRGRGQVELEPDAERALMAYSWPGNIRELRNVLERAQVLSPAPVLEAADLRLAQVHASPADEAALTLEEVEKRHIELVLARENGRVSRAAEALGIARSSLYEKLRRYRIPAPPES